MHATLREISRGVHVEEVWSPPVATAEEEGSHTQDHEEGEGERGLER